MRALALVSGGPDSAVSLARAVMEHGSRNVEAVSFHYGQRHDREVSAAADICEHYGVLHSVFDLRDIYFGGSCALLVDGEELPVGSYADQLQSGDHLATEVPFRNGLMMAVLAAMSDCKPVEVWIGVHADDSTGESGKTPYPDCSPEFIHAFDEALRIGTSGRVSVQAPLLNMSKAEVIAEGLRIGVPFELTWSCYRGGSKPCGECATCRARAEAFRANGIPDPALGGVA